MSCRYHLIQALYICHEVYDKQTIARERKPDQCTVINIEYRSVLLYELFISFRQMLPTECVEHIS